MTNFDEYRKDTVPAFGESEKAYFLRIVAEYKDLRRDEAHQQLMSRLAAFFRSFTSKPNLLRNLSFR